MKSLRDDVGVYSIEEDALSLSGQALLDLVQAVLERGLPLRFRARGGSMAPFIRDGDVIEVAPLAQGQPRLGDVVAFVHPDSSRLVVHRMVARQGSKFMILGDNQTGSPEGWVPRGSLLGRVQRIERGDRRVYLGLGPERAVIAFFSRLGLLKPVVGSFGSILRRLKRLGLFVGRETA